MSTPSSTSQEQTPLSKHQVNTITARILTDSATAVQYLQKAHENISAQVAKEAPNVSAETLQAVEQYHTVMEQLHDHHTNGKLAVSGVKMSSKTGDKMGIKTGDSCRCTCEHPVTKESLTIPVDEIISSSSKTSESLKMLNSQLKTLNIGVELTHADVQVKKAPVGADNGLGPYAQHYTVSS